MLLPFPGHRCPHSTYSHTVQYRHEELFWVHVRKQNPTRGSQVLQFGACRLSRPFAFVVPYHIAPLEPSAGLVTVGSKEAMLPFTSCQPVMPCQRMPTFSVRFGRSLISSWTKTCGLFILPPHSGVTLAFQLARISEQEVRKSHAGIRICLRYCLTAYTHRCKSLCPHWYSPTQSSLRD